MISRKGNYTKFINFKDNNILTFIANNEHDNNHIIMKLLQQRYSDYTAFQACEDKEEYSNHKTLFYIRYNTYGDPMEYKYIHFDFDNDKIITDQGRTYKIKTDYNYAYKVQKTQIKADRGIHGLYNVIVEAMHVNSPLNSAIYSMIEKLDKQHEKAA